MIITVKNLQQQQFTIEFERERTVHELKEKIFKERGAEYIIEKQKLIYAGVILDDQRTIDSYKIDEKKFVVVMLKRDLLGANAKSDEINRPNSSVKSGKNEEDTCETEMSTIPAKLIETNANEIKTNASAISSSDEGKKSSASSEVVLDPFASSTNILTSSSVGAEVSQSVFSNTSLQSRAESNWLMGEEYNRTVESMIEMGYGREMVERALAASFNNPERAVEYLISGIPENEEGLTAPMETTGNDGTGDAVRGTIGNSGGNRSDSVGGNVNRSTASPNLRTGDGGPENTPGDAAPPNDDPFEFLRNQPQFVQMRSLVYQNPELLHAVLQQIGQTNPALLQLISENQDAFLSMLNQPTAGQVGGSPQYPRRITPGRRAQLAAAAAVAAGANDSHTQNVDTAPGMDGEDPIQVERPAEVGDASADNVSDAIIPRRPDSEDNFERDRAAAAAVAALTAAVSAAIERDAGVGDGERGSEPVSAHNDGLGIITLTQHDRAAIERLKALGFPENLVLQAYFACDKDEELAANFLISSAFDD